MIRNATTRRISAEMLEENDGFIHMAEYSRRLKEAGYRAPKLNLVQAMRLFRLPTKHLKIHASRTVGPHLRFRIFKRDSYRCQVCGGSARDGLRLQVDHIVPWSKGGKTEESNLWTLCFDCNQGKGNQSL